MIDAVLNNVLAQLEDAFSAMVKPVPLATYYGSNCDEEVDSFNATDWREATYYDVVEGMEGFVICGSKTKAYLLPMLFKMILLNRYGAAEEGAEDNLSMELENWPIDEEVGSLLNLHQKKAVIAAWAYLDEFKYSLGERRSARLLAEHWNLSK